MVLFCSLLEGPELETAVAWLHGAQFPPLSNNGGIVQPISSGGCED